MKCSICNKIKEDIVNFKDILMCVDCRDAEEKEIRQDKNLKI